MSIEEAGKMVMASKRKWSDEPMYKVNHLKPQEDIGYIERHGKGQGIDDIRRKRDIRSPTESPLKIWWLEQQRIKNEQTA